MEWLKEKWNVVIGALAALFAALFVLVRVNANSRKQKEILKKANESHEAENKANKRAEDKKDAGLSEIDKKSAQERDKIHRASDKQIKDLEKEKSNFVSEQEKSDTLAKDLADEIGADFVEPDTD